MHMWKRQTFEFVSFLKKILKALHFEKSCLFHLTQKFFSFSEPKKKNPKCFLKRTQYFDN